MCRSRTALAILAAATVAATAGSTLAFASRQAAEDGGDTFNVAKGTTVTATNVGNVVFVAHTNVGDVTTTCTFSTFSGKTGAGLKFAISPPVFSDGGGAPCTDVTGATDTFAASRTNAAWALKEIDHGADEGLPEPNATHDRMGITLPQAGLVDTNSSSPGCTVTFAPSGPVTVIGKYNDAGTFKLTDAPIPVVFSSACQVTGTSVSLSLTYNLSPALFDQG